MTKRREKFDATRKEEFLALLAKGIRPSNAAKKVGIDRRTYQNHINKYPKFAEACTRAEMDANELIEQSLFNSALKGNVTAQQVWLYNRDPERWQDKRNVTVGGDKNNPLEINLSGEELDAEIKRLIDIANKAIAPVVVGKGEK
jgi:hypothetical protein